MPCARDPAGIIISYGRGINEVLLAAPANGEQTRLSVHFVSGIDAIRALRRTVAQDADPDFQAQKECLLLCLDEANPDEKMKMKGQASPCTCSLFLCCGAVALIASLVTP